VLGAGAVGEFGTVAQQERWAAPAGQGSVLLTAALAEEDGDDPRSPSARAERRPGGWVLSGVKTAVDYAPSADVFLVPCAAPDGVRVFLVEPSDGGVAVQPQRLTDPAPAGRVLLDGVALDEDRLLGARDGAVVADWLADRATVGLCALQAGVIERALELTAEYARHREQFGRPIGSFQAVKHMLADMYVSATLARSNSYYGAWALSTSASELPEAAAAARISATQAFQHCAKNNIQVHGGMGFTWEFDCHLYYRRANALALSLGSLSYWEDALIERMRKRNAA